MSALNQPHDDSSDLVEQAIAEYLEAIDNRIPLDEQDWLKRHASIRAELIEFLESEKEFGEAFPSNSSTSESILDATVDMPSNSASSSPVKQTTFLGPNSKIGPYKLGKLLGAGGMGRVFEAVDPNGTLVAVKVLSPKWTNSSESLQRFKQEGKIASTINHPRCVFVKAADEDNGTPYIVMELMTGKTLKDLGQESGKLPVSKAVEAIMDVLDGLEEAHVHGMIHRDIKPGNCYLESNGRVKLGDFGLARSIDDSSDLTRTGDFVGTPLFASPEQVKGYSVDVRTDIYSICATLYYLLAGQAPFSGGSPTSVIAKIVSEDPTPLRELNPQVPLLLERVIMRGLRKDRKARFQSAAELKQALEPFVSGRSALAAWGRRFAAFGLDSTLTGCLGAITAQLIDIQKPEEILPLTVYLSLLLPVVLYHFVFEGVGSASLGKRLLRLQIVNRKTGEKPSRLRMFLRTLVGILLLGVLTDLSLYTFHRLSGHAIQNVSNWMIVQWIGYTICYIMLLSPILFHRRYRMLLHDWISGTMVIDRPRPSPQQSLAGAASNYRLPLLAASAYPAKFGEFNIHGLICSSGSNAWLAGRNEQLGRNVWILLRPTSEPEFSATRRNCDRSTRLRWLTNGREGNWQWDAFLATSGAPLKHWSAPESPLDWKSTRAILKQLLEELEQSSQEGTSVNIQTLDQVWMDSRGRIVLIDWSPSDASLHLFNQASAQIQSDQTKGVLCETARQMLCGKSLPIAGPHPPISAIVPIHIRKLLSSVTTDHPSKATPFQPSQFLQTLESNSNRSTEPTFENRLLGLGFLAIPGLLLVGTMASLSRIGNHLILEKITDQLVAPLAVDWLLNHETELESLSKDIDKGLPSVEELRAWQDKQGSLVDRHLKEYEVRYAGLGSFAKIVADESNLIDDPKVQLAHVTIELQDKGLVAKDWKREGTLTRIDMQGLKRIVNATPEAKPISLLRRSPFRILVVTNFPILLWILWAAITSGGISMWISGLRIVQSDGSPVSFSLRCIRALLAGIPFLTLQSFITWNDLHYTDRLWASAVAHQALMWLFLVYVILIVAFPRRAPHDWLLGTFLVPK